VQSPSLARPAATEVGEDGGGGSPGERESELARDRRIFRTALALTLLPLAVSAVALVVGVRGDYLPTADHALTEMQVRDLGRHPVLIGLYSRADWNHPGPLLFYALAPFYWLTGGASIGMALGALAINGGSVAGTAAIARRRGGTPLAVCVLLGCALLMRTLGAGFVYDAWNCYVTTLPFGLMIFLAWAMAAGDAWALPVGAVVASYLAQAHVGFVALALPLLAWGAGWLVVSVWRRARDDERRRKVTRAALAAAGLLVVLWVPPVVDLFVNAPSNAGNIVRWFTSGDEEAHTLAQGWRVVTAQLAVWPEWLAGKRSFAFGTGESRYLASAPLPVLLVPAAVAGAALWRRAQRDSRTLVLTLGLTLVLGILAVARTVGPAFDYRLRWTWVPAMIVVAVTAWAAWLALVDRGARPARGLVPLAAAALAVLGGVNTVSAGTAGTPQGGDSRALATLMPQIMDALPEGEGEVVVSDVFANGAWFARGIVLNLERRGIDARVPPDLARLFGDHRVHRGGPVRARLVVGQEEAIEPIADEPGMRLVARWAAAGWERMRRLNDEAAEVDADRDAGRISEDEFVDRAGQIHDERAGDDGATVYGVAVFLDER
jgi:hypothetical protein